MIKLKSPYYFWYLNTIMDDKTMLEQLREMHKQGVECVCPHPWPPEFRPERMPSDMSPEYLSDEYFEKFKQILSPKQMFMFFNCENSFGKSILKKEQNK